jgi:hypothetical protein
MNFYQQICAFLLFLSLEAIYVAQWKIYPIVFSLFICAVCITLSFSNARLSWDRFHKTAWRGCCAYPLYVLTVYFVRGGDTVVMLKMIVNVLFFLAACLFFVSMRNEGKAKAVTKIIISASFVSVVLSFAQTFTSVAVGHLWSWPLSITDSTDAYAIQDACRIYLGDQNKNIWATKTLFSYLTFFTLRDSRWRIKDCVALCMFLFVMVYTSSRTAQLALIASISLYALRQAWPRAHFFGKSSVLALAGGAVMLGLTILRIPSANIDISQGAGGDGLLARVLLWNYFADAAPDFSLGESVFGHGVFAVSSFMNRVFEENNLHNVFLNQFFDLGAVGVALYGCFLLFFFLSLSPRRRWLFVPAVVIAINSQYFGYDAELMILFAVSVLLGDCVLRRETFHQSVVERCPV